MDERQRLARDLHDGAQSELVSLVIRLKQVEEAPNTPTALAATVAALGDHAIAALESVRAIAHGIDPLPLTTLGFLDALRAQAARAPRDVSISGTAPRSNAEAESAVYFACTEALQNVAKHAGNAARVNVSLRYDHATLTVRVEDDGLGFEPTQIREGAGLRNLRDRIETVGGCHELTSSPGRGTLLTISVPWPPRQPRTDAPSSLGQCTAVLVRLLMLAVVAVAGEIVLGATQATVALTVAAAALALLTIAAPLGGRTARRAPLRVRPRNPGRDC